MIIETLAQSSTLQFTTCPNNPLPSCGPSLTLPFRGSTACKSFSHTKLLQREFSMKGRAAQPAQSEWADVLTVNRQNLTWLIQRMSSDFNSQHTKMRKPWSSKELVPSSHHLIFSFPFSCLVGFSSAFEIHIQRNCPFATPE